MKNNNTVATNARVWEIVNGVMGSDVSVKIAVEDSRSRKRFKSEVKEYVSTLVTADRVIDFTSTLIALKAVSEDRINDLWETLGLDGYVQGTAIDKPEKLGENPTEAEGVEYKNAWAAFNLYERTLLHGIRIDLITHVMDKKTKKVLSKALTALVTAHVRGTSGNTIANAVVASVSRAVGVSDSVVGYEMAMSFMDILHTDKFIRLHKTAAQASTDADVRLEFVYSMDVPKSLYLTQLETGNGAPSLVKPGYPEKDIVKKHKASYEQSVEPMADVIDTLQGVAFKYKKNVSKADIVRIAQLAVKEEDEELGIFDEAWKQRTKAKYVNDFMSTQEIGDGKFYNTAGTDGVGRIYWENRIGLSVSDAHDLIEFSNQKPLDATGLWALRQLMCDKMGFKINGMKPTEEEAEKAFYENYEDWKASGEQSELFDIYENPQIATGYVAEIDGQTQGPGIFGLSTLDPQLLFGTGFIGNTVRTDLYLGLSVLLNTKLSTTTWTRLAAKSPLMTKGYGAGFNTIMFGSKGKLNSDGSYEVKSGSKKQTPLMATAEDAGIYDTKHVWKAYKSSMNALVPVMLETQAYLSARAEMFVGNKQTWLMPDDVEASVINQKMSTRHIKWIDHNNKIHTMQHSFMVEDTENTTAITPRLIQSIDAYILRFVTRMCEKQGIELAVDHDGYMCHLNDTKQVMSFYRTAAMDVVQRDLLTDITRQAFNDDSIPSFQEGKDVDEVIDAIDNGKYALWF